ncbi:pleiotropic drug resistance ABC transporter [Imleria badia]|nr:pleiotropic drug resistance ABC transporter [Imleria badia]
MTGSLQIHLQVSELDSQNQSPESIHQDKQLPRPSTANFNDGSSIESFIKDVIQQCVKDGAQMQTLGIMFRDLRVVGLGVGAAVQHNLVSLLYPQSIIKRIKTWRHPPVRNIVSDFEGVVLPGEMLLVLGRPGAGCSTFLKTLANHRGDSYDVQGDVFYDSFSSVEIEKRYRGDVIYCPEDDVHFTTLNIRETLEFASTMRTPSRMDSQSRSAHAIRTAEALMRIFGLEHARSTVVGDASLRGISGGEKRRVSLAEVVSARGKLVCWDNPTRGLDSSTALEFIRTLRVAADAAKVTTVVSLYQAGEQLFNLFDKVCLIYEGRMAYYGPAEGAKRYFTDMGYEPQDRQTTPDFLVATTDPHGRKTRLGFQGVIPRTADEMTSYFRTSAHCELNRTLIDSYHNLYVNKPDLKMAYDASATSKHSRHAASSQSYALSIPMQVHAVMRRRWQILKGDWATQAVQVGSVFHRPMFLSDRFDTSNYRSQIFQAIFTGTVFLQLASNTSAYYSRDGLLIFALFCSSTLSKGALYYPFIESLAHLIVEVPINFISVAVMSIIIYFLAGLQKSAEQFFTYILFTYTANLVMKICFRTIATLSTGESTALPVAGSLSLVLVLYTGYAVPVTSIVWALRWIAYLNPLRYAFESLMLNEFHTINGTCTTLVPSGPGYENATLANQVCAIVGSQPGMVTVPGDAYTYVSFGYSFSNLWRNFGILWVFCFGLLATLLFFTQHNKRTARDNTVTLYKEGSDPVPVHQVVDEERVDPGDLHEKREENTADNSNAATITGILESKKAVRGDIVSWTNIQYEVPVSGGEMRKLLDDVSGYVAPGKLTALMGETGAGKTVLLNVLAQHTSVGVVRGACLVNGQPLPANFRAQTAYVQQMDTHIAETTVRKALLFSARLRQPSSIPTAEKEAYVDKCLKMCGLEAHADAIVGSLGVEHRKRTTIGVELAAKPKLLLFLDEPTSGLDSQSAWAVVTFLRELADSGQAILCTIHQPSGELFQVFDFLRKGGQTVYFGDIGERSMTVIEYFQRNGAPLCAADANPAEYMLDVIGVGATATCTTDWHQVWNDSPEAVKLELEIDRIHQEGRYRPVVSTEMHSKFASSWIQQLALLIHRGFVCNWRNAAYIYSKLVVCVVAGLVIGFTFFGATNFLWGCPNSLCSVFIAAGICLPLAQQVQSKFIVSRAIYEVRERPARMYTWSAFLVSEILIEIPWNMLGSSLVFFCWYWTSGFDSSRAGFSYLCYCVVFPLYYTTFGLAMVVISPNGVIASTLFSVLVSFMLIFAGVLQTYSQLGWWQWMYYVSPITYVIEGLLGQALGNQLITCTSTEFGTIEPPLGMSCSAYMDPYIALAGGYLADPNATAACAFCPFRTTDAYMQFNFNVSNGHHWRDLGIILGVTGFNVLFMFAGMYFFRIRRGMGWAGLKRAFVKAE